MLQSTQAFPWNSVGSAAEAGDVGEQLLCPVCRAPLTDAEVAQLRVSASSDGCGAAGGVACCRSCQYQIVGGEAERSPAVDGTAAVSCSTSDFQAHMPMPLHVRCQILGTAARSLGIGNERLGMGNESHSHDRERLRSQIEEWLLF